MKRNNKRSCFCYLVKADTFSLHKMQTFGLLAVVLHEFRNMDGVDYGKVKSSVWVRAIVGH